MNGKYRRRGRKEEEGTGPSLGSPIASELANTITVPLPSPILTQPPPLPGKPAQDGSAPEPDREDSWVWRLGKRGAGLTPPVLGTKMTQKGKDSDSD